MKSYSDFIKESTRSRPAMQATRLRLVSNGHGDWYTKSGEFVAKTNGQGLTFYNQNQRFGKRDPAQIRTLKNQQIAATQNPNEEYEKNLRERYISGEIFNVGESVENLNNGFVGKIIRRGTNHLICVTEDGEMFKSWIKDVKEWTDVSGVPASQREIGTDALRKYVMRLTNTKKIKNFNVDNFINKYKKKSN